jgi:RNA polymerase sigma-70 factor (ECF subfamily)
MTEAEIAALYVEHGYFLFRRCLAFMGDEASAQDAVQEVFVRALRSGGEFRGDADPKTWLARISDHHCIDVLRRRRTRGERGGASAGPPGGEDDADDERDPNWRLVRQDDPEALLTARRLMSSLAADEQRLAVLYFVDELTQDEMADELGLSRKTIGKYLKKVSARARSLLGERKRAP